MRVSLLLVLVVLAAVLSLASAKVYFQDEFTAGIRNWVQSDNKKDQGSAGPIKWTAGRWYGDEDADKGMQTGQDARFFTYSAKLEKPFSNKGKDLVFQFSVKHEQDIDCGGAYLKLLPESVDAETFNGDSPYEVMFGPDICGYGTRKIHLIFSHKGKNYLWKKEPKCETDQLTHVYTLVLHPDNTYEVYVDLEKRESGNLVDDWDMLPPREIEDPDAKKPEDWVDEAEIDDPEDKKPEDWDKMPEMIDDPNAKKPDDWDDEEDGEWSPPQIKNPQWKGEWKPRKIPNPAYKGPWKAPKIANPEFKEDPQLYVRNKIGSVGLEIWQVKSGTIFDNVIVTDDFDEAKDLAERTWKAHKEDEKKAFDAIQEEKRKKEDEERKKREEEAKKKKKDEEEEEESSASEKEEKDEEKKPKEEEVEEEKAKKAKPAEKAKKTKRESSATQEAKNKARGKKLEKMKEKLKQQDAKHDEL